MHYFSNLFGKELCIFRADLLSIIRSLNTLFTATGVCRTSYVDCSVNITSRNYTICCEYSLKTPDDGQ